MGKKKATTVKRFQVLQRDNFRCVYCGITSKQTHLTVDHILPQSKGGKNTIENMITSCSQCNRGKGSLELTNEQLKYVREKNI